MALYADHAATSPIRREVLEAMWPALTSVFGNPSSVHEAGTTAAALLGEARAEIARELGCRPGELVLTSGGTEADNLAVKGIVLASTRGRHLVTTPIEHEAVLASADYLTRLHDAEITMLPVDGDGLVSPDDLAAAIRPDTALVSVQHANSEIGTVQPIAELAAVARAAGVPIHTDAVQSAARLPVRRDALGVDALSIAGHKLGAPKGVGALVVRATVPLEPLLHGGGQQRGARSGTEDLAAALGLAAALRTTREARERDGAGDGVTAARDAIIDGVLAGIPAARLTGPRAARLTGPRAARLPDHASFVFPGVGGETVLLELERRGVISSSGSACAAGSTEPSHVLLAVGIDPVTAGSAVRITLGPDAGLADGERIAVALVESVGSLGALRA